MAERVPPPDGPNNNPLSPPPPPPPPHQPPPSSSEPTAPAFRPGTFIVQVPKDQVYRVPPPENAMIVERHRNQDNNKRRPFCSCFCCFLITIIFVLAIGLVVGLVGGLIL